MDDAIIAARLASRHRWTEAEMVAHLRRQGYDIDPRRKTIVPPDRALAPTRRMEKAKVTK